MAREAICTPVPLISYTSQPTRLQAACPRRCTISPAPEAWWIRQRSSRGCAAAAHRDAGLPGRDDLALLEHPAGAVEYGDADPGRVVDRAAAHGGPGGAAHLDAGRRARHDPQVRQLRGAVLDEQRGRGRVLALHMQVLDDGGGAHGQRRRRPAGAMRTEPAEPSGPRSVTARVDDEVLPVGAGGDGEDVAVARGLQGRGEGGVLAGAAPPPRGAGVRHLDRALCHGAVVPPPRAPARLCRPDPLRGQLKEVPAATEDRVAPP